MNAQEPEIRDLESRLTDDHHQSLRLWLRMLSCSMMIEREIRSRLREQFSITLPRFDLMAQLERYPEGLRMGELSRRMMVTGGNVTGITDQLEAEGLVIREADHLDRRVYTVRLTEQGRQSFHRMAKVHEGWVKELMSGLPADEKDQMQTILTRLKNHLTAASRD